MKKLISIFMILIVFTTEGCSSRAVNTAKKYTADQLQSIADKENKYVLMVKNGHPEKYSDSTYGKSFEKFFGSPTWKYFKSDDGKDVVEFTGECKYQEVDVKARMQFILNVKDGTFEAGALSFNDVPQSQLITTAILSKVFEDSVEKMTSPSNNENSNNANKNNSNEEKFYGQWVIKKVVKYGNAGTYTEEDINQNIIGKQLRFSKEKASSFGDDISYMENIVDNPIYKKSTISKDDFVVNYRVPMDSLGIKDDSATEIEVIDSNDNIQCTFFIKDEKTLILFGGGVFFELHKK